MGEQINSYNTLNKINQEQKEIFDILLPYRDELFCYNSLTDALPNILEKDDIKIRWNELTDTQREDIKDTLSEISKLFEEYECRKVEKRSILKEVAGASILPVAFAALVPPLIPLSA